MAKNQRTIRRPVEYAGVGLFSGVPGVLKASPAPAGAGVTFVRSDLPGRPRLPVKPSTVISKQRHTAVHSDAGEIATIEHVMSALGGLGIDNIELDLNSTEVPTGDGSSKPFLDLFLSAGIEDQGALRKTIQIREPIAISEKDVYIAVLPSEQGLTVNYTYDYPGTGIPVQQMNLAVDEGSYAAQIAPARTFCTEAEAEQLLQAGLGKGASKEHTIVVGPKGPSIPLRFPDEYVRHKILDLIGDFASLGGTLNAHVVAARSGHSTNLKLVRKIADTFEEGTRTIARNETLLDVREIEKILPHRYPMLLIDKVIEMDGYRRAVGIKNVTYNEPFFAGHFPGQPMMPGVLQIEAMAQLAGVLLMRKSDNQAKVAVLLSLDEVKLRKSVVPGDQLRIEVETLRVKARVGEVFGRATVDGQIAAEANMKFMLMDSP